MRESGSALRSQYLLCAEESVMEEGMETGHMIDSPSHICTDYHYHWVTFFGVGANECLSRRVRLWWVFPSYVLPFIVKGKRTTEELYPDLDATYNHLESGAFCGSLTSCPQLVSHLIPRWGFFVDETPSCGTSFPPAALDVQVEVIFPSCRYMYSSDFFFWEGPDTSRLESRPRQGRNLSSCFTLLRPLAVRNRTRNLHSTVQGLLWSQPPRWIKKKVKVRVWRAAPLKAAHKYTDLLKR